jgi:hypothetical protein
MKKILILILTIILISQVVLAEKSISETLEEVDQYYHLVLAEEAVGGDTAAATDIVLGLQKYNNLEINTVIDGEISNSLPKIYIGPFCGSNYLESIFGYPCEEWPYGENQAIVKVEGNNLIITGTSPTDRRRAGVILREYPDYQSLKDYSFIIISGDSLTSAELTIDKAKEENEFVCGDGICEPGESFICFPDCNKKSCNDLCNEDGYTDSYCREVPTNPNVRICESEEVNKGLKYCAGEKSCCCKSEQIEEMLPFNEPINEKPHKEKSFFEEFFSNEGATKNIVFTFLVIVIVILGIWFILSR